LPRRSASASCFTDQRMKTLFSAIFRVRGLVCGTLCMLAVAGCGTGRRCSDAGEPIVSWDTLASPAQFAGLSVGLSAPAGRVRRGSLFAISVLVRNDGDAPLQIPQDIMGRLGIVAEMDGAVEAPVRFDYCCPTHNHIWTLMPGDTVQRLIPLFTGDAEERLKRFENIHGIPLPVAAELVGIRAGGATNVRLRLVPIGDGGTAPADGGPVIALRVEP